MNTDNRQVSIHQEWRHSILPPSILFKNHRIAQYSKLIKSGLPSSIFYNFFFIIAV